MIYDLVVIPLLFLLRWTIIPWVPKARERVFYEKRARHFKGARSFKEDHLKADLAVEFSSEGEFQQCLPLVEASLKEGKKIELIYFSPSVEKGVRAIYEKYPDQIRVLNFPLLTYGANINCSLRRWMSAEKLILVRYDFLPEILLWARNPKHELSLIWASFKKKRLKSQMLSGYQMLFLKASKHIVASTEADADYLKKHGLSVMSIYDFRVVQIMNRLKNRHQTLVEKFPGWSDFEKFLCSFNIQDRLLLGNAWPHDMDPFTDDFFEAVEKKEKLFVIVPHLVGGEHQKVWKEKLKELNLPILELTAETPVSELLAAYQKTPSVIVIHLKGVLCELYHYFGYSYVGGGHGVSVHSLLEPYVSGSQFIACGPKVERSTEFDLSNQDYPVVSVIQNQTDFAEWVKTETGDNLEGREKKLEKYLASFDDVRKRLLSC